MADGNIFAHSSGIDPWLIIGLAAKYQQDFDMFVRAEMNTMADASDYMLNALQELAGIHLHDDKNYFTFGPGNDEYLRNTEGNSEKA